MTPPIKENESLRDTVLSLTEKAVTAEGGKIAARNRAKRRAMVGGLCSSCAGKGGRTGGGDGDGYNT